VLKFFLCLPALLALSVAASGVRAQAIGDPKQGLALAQQTCSPCHATVAEQDRSPNARAPIVDLAAASGMTNAALLALSPRTQGCRCSRSRRNSGTT
jgi:hypothetical protein